MLAYKYINKIEIGEEGWAEFIGTYHADKDLIDRFLLWKMKCSQFEVRDVQMQVKRNVRGVPFISFPNPNSCDFILNIGFTDYMCIFVYLLSHGFCKIFYFHDVKIYKNAASPKGQPWVPTPSFCFDLYRKIMAVPELDLEDLY